MGKGKHIGKTTSLLKRNRFVLLLFVLGTLSSCCPNPNLFKIISIKNDSGGQYSASYGGETIETSFGGFCTIIATRRDSTFYIVSPENTTHIDTSDIIVRGGYYSLDIVPVDPHLFPSYRAQKGTDDCFYYLWSKYHWTAYYVKNLNGRYLETPEDNFTRQRILESVNYYSNDSNSSINKLDRLSGSMKALDRLTGNSDSIRMVSSRLFKIQSIKKLCPDYYLIKAYCGDSIYTLVSPILSTTKNNSSSTIIKKGKSYNLDVIMVGGFSPVGYPAFPELCRHVFLFNGKNKIDNYYYITNSNGVYLKTSDDRD